MSGKSPVEVKRLTKEAAKKWMQIEGETRGVAILADWDVIRQEKGEEGLRKLENKMAELGYPLKFKEIKATTFYPAGIDAISMLAIRELFGFEEDDFTRMGAAAVKSSLFLKIFMKYFLSVKMLIREAPQMWRRHYSVGDLEISELDEEEKYAVIRLKGLDIHPYFCASLKGYFSKVLEMAIKGSVTCEQTRCTFRGDRYHEFLLKWK